MKDNILIYIASPFSGDVERNIEFARAACRFCIDMGHTPIAVHLLYPQILDDKDPAQREAGLQLGGNVLEHCNEMWVCGSEISAGMNTEIELAKTLGMPIRHFTRQQILDTPEASAVKMASLIAVCKDKVHPAPHEYPIHDYPWGIKEVGSVDELIEAFEHGNWSVRTGFVLGALAFIEQVSSGNEWLALKYDGGMWQSFESFSFYHMLHQYGADYCKSFIETLHDTPLPEFAYPTEPEPFISEPELQP